MSALSIQVPFPVFQDRDGQPLDNGYVWLGTSSLNPQTNPVVAYYDSALTTVATQPLRTINGFISRAGSPAQVYVDAVNFSVLVQDRQGTTVFSVPDGTGISPNASGVVYDPAGTGAVATTVQAKLREVISSADRSGTVGVANVGLGAGVLPALTSGSGNTIVGNGAGAGITTSYGNTAVGLGALAASTQSGDQNTALGRFTLAASTTGYENVAVGTSALGASTTANINVAIGRKAGLRITTGNENTCVGTNSMGDEAQVGVSTGDGNAAFGRNTLKANTTGYSNTALGRSALATNTTGSQNVAVGQSALVYATTGVDNVAVGANSLATNIVGLANVAVGASSLLVATGDRNTALGNGALLTTTTGTNVIGIGDGVTATSATTSNEITLGNNNITNVRIPGIGFTATSSNVNTTGKYRITGVGTVPTGAEIAFGTNGGGTRAVYNAPSGGEHNFSINGSNILALASTLMAPIPDNTMTLGTGALRWSVVYAATGAINTSDARTKQQVKGLSDAENAVARRIKGLIRTFKFNEAVDSKGDEARIHIGVMAQEVAAAFEAEGLDAYKYALFCFDSWGDQFEDVYEGQTFHHTDGSVETRSVKTGVREVLKAGNRFGIRYDQLLAFIIAAL